MILNTDEQIYKGIPLRLIVRKSYIVDKAKRFSINNTNQNVWIPNCYLTDDGTIKEGVNIDFIFKKAKRQLEIAGVRFPNN